MKLLKETSVAWWNAVPATAASPTLQGLAHPGIPVQCKVTAVVFIPVTFLVLNLGNKSRMSLHSADSLIDCKVN